MLVFLSSIRPISPNPSHFVPFNFQGYRHYRSVTIIMFILYTGSSQTTSPPDGNEPVMSSDNSETVAEPTASGMNRIFFFFFAFSH